MNLLLLFHIAVIDMCIRCICPVSTEQDDGKIKNCEEDTEIEKRDRGQRQAAVFKVLSAQICYAHPSNVF